MEDGGCGSCDGGGGSSGYRRDCGGGPSRFFCIFGTRWKMMDTKVVIEVVVEVVVLVW